MTYFDYMKSNIFSPTRIKVTIVNKFGYMDRETVLGNYCEVNSVSLEFAEYNWRNTCLAQARVMKVVNVSGLKYFLPT